MIDVNNESGWPADEKQLVRLSGFALAQLRIHPQADLSILLVDEATMTQYHEKFMDLPGPTDVLSFPMDELRVPKIGQPPPQGLLGDIVLCPAEIKRRAPQEGRTLDDEMAYLVLHGLLHLLGYDHAEPAEEAAMFKLQDTLFASWKRAEASR